MPASATHRSTPAGPRSITTPSASNTSADPDADDAARLPCLHTGTPAPATTKAAMVDTFTLWLRSPPVPQVSMASGLTCTGSANASMVRTRPVISSTVSPRVRRAMAKPAIWAEVAFPSKMSASAAAACSAVSPAGAVASANTPGQPPSSSMFNGPPLIPPNISVQDALGDEAELDLGAALHDRELGGVPVPLLGGVVLHVA